MIKHWLHYSLEMGDLQILVERREMDFSDSLISQDANFFFFWCVCVYVASVGGGGGWGIFFFFLVNDCD